MLNVPLVSEVGRYLEVPFIQQRVTMNTYKQDLERIQTKLQGWKSRVLSLAAQVTLIKAVTSSVPSYVMQTTFLPKGICNQIDQC